MRRTGIIVAALLLVATQLAGQNAAEQKGDANTRLTLQVLNETNQQPVVGAHVVVRFTEERLLRRDKRVSWEAKTNRKGEIVLSDLPTGNVKVQVIAKGFQTYGDQHDLEKPQEKLTILLQPPKGQVSAY
ncbi:MAG: hypothetical protein A3H94_08475 [Acidobacteria bacterium RIFCSPLOWO2_02_FULL_60_20]|nr:MAG: hypothetical protein A3H94_08475 [Acidobacteria bacterium RIFCSPLOWO2_02_FULL_60_20]